MCTLPIPRTLLTSLFNALATPAPSPPIQNQTEIQTVNLPHDRSPPSNPLKSLSSAHKALLSTMHVLFTPPMLLQALDLLDRGLVLRVVARGVGSSRGGDVVQAGGEEEGEVTGDGGGPGAGPEISPPQASVLLTPNISLARAPDSAPTAHTHPTTLYQVRSSQPPKSRFRSASSPASGTGSKIYTVRLEAWNCSCAAFAFASFPASSLYPAPSDSPWNLDQDQDLDRDRDRDYHLEDRQPEHGNERDTGIGVNRDEKWGFGGLSMDGKDGGAVPCCKHLLACVLGERWDVLRGFVEERVVSNEEMAGLGCEG